MVTLVTALSISLWQVAVAAVLVETYLPIGRALAAVVVLVA